MQVHYCTPSLHPPFGCGQVVISFRGTSSLKNVQADLQVCAFRAALHILQLACQAACLPACLPGSASL